MDDRKQEVLRAIVALYGAEGEPIGSGLLAQHFHLAVSSATLRNEMAALTRLGLLEQPHTSAGRVPSAKGYRYYIDYLMPAQTALSRAQQHEIEQIFDELDYDPARLAEGVAKALAERTGLAVVATTPSSEDTTVAHYELIEVGKQAVAVLAVTNTGSVRTRVARLPQPVAAQQLQLTAKTLNALLTFRAPADIAAEQLRAMAEAAGSASSLPIVKAAYQLLREAGRASVFLEGQQNLLRFPEVRGSVQTLLELFADEAAVRRSVVPRGDKITVRLGEDLPEYPMPGMCVITKPYIAGGGSRGTLNMVGPTRLNFTKVIPQLEYFALLLGQAMSGLNG